MYNFTHLKFSIMAIGGFVLTILGWHHVAATMQIFTGFAQGGPALLIVGIAIFAAPQLSFYKGDGVNKGLTYLRRAIYLGSAMSLAFITAVVNYQVMKHVYPRAAVTDQIDMPDGMAR